MNMLSVWRRRGFCSTVVCCSRAMWMRSVHIWGVSLLRRTLLACAFCCWSRSTQQRWGFWRGGLCLWGAAAVPPFLWVEAVSAVSSSALERRPACRHLLEQGDAALEVVGVAGMLVGADGHAGHRRPEDRLRGCAPVSPVVEPTGDAPLASFSSTGRVPVVSFSGEVPTMFFRPSAGRCCVFWFSSPAPPPSPSRPRVP